MAAKNITGLRFGRLVAINPTEKRSKRGVVYWLCKCDCGNEVVVRRDNLRNGKGGTRSCGCLAIEVHKEHGKELGKKFGRKFGGITGKKNRKHYGCIYCESDKHYAKGYCRSCYLKLKRGTLV